MSGKNSYSTERARRSGEEEGVAIANDRNASDIVDPFLLIPNIGTNSNNDNAGTNSESQNAMAQLQQQQQQQHLCNPPEVDRIGFVSSASMPISCMDENTKNYDQESHHQKRQQERFEDEFAEKKTFECNQYMSSSNTGKNPFTEKQRSLLFPNTTAGELFDGEANGGEVEVRLGGRGEENPGVEAKQWDGDFFPFLALQETNESKLGNDSIPGTPPSVPEDLMNLSSNIEDDDEKVEVIYNPFIQGNPNINVIQDTKFNIGFPKVPNNYKNDDEDRDAAEKFDASGSDSNSLDVLANPDDDAEESPFLWMNSNPQTAPIPDEVVLDDDQRMNMEDEVLTGDGEESNPIHPQHKLFQPPILSSSGLPRPRNIQSDDRQTTPQSWQTPRSARPKGILRNISGGSKRTARAATENATPLTPRSARSSKSEKYYYSYEADPSAPPTPVPPFIVVHNAGSAVVKVKAQSIPGTAAPDFHANNFSEENAENKDKTRRGSGNAKQRAMNWCHEWGRPVTISLSSAVFVLALVTVVSSLMASQTEEQPIPEIGEIDFSELSPFQSPSVAPAMVLPTLSPTNYRDSADVVMFPVSEPDGYEFSNNDDDELVVDAVDDEYQVTINPIWEGVVKRPYEETQNPAIPTPTQPPRTFPPTSATGNTPVPTAAPSMLPEGFPAFVPTSLPFFNPQTPEPSPGNHQPKDGPASSTGDDSDLPVPWNNYVIGLLSVESPSTFSKLDDETSPQFLALQWISLDASRKGGSMAYTMDACLQRYALAVAYFALGGFVGGSGGAGDDENDEGRRWFDDESWLSNEVGECDWYGVVCDETGARVRSLELEGNGLSGSLPPELDLLKHLEILRLDRNSIGGSLPPDYSGLGDLLELRLSDNDMTGSIPWEYGGFGSFDSLRVLDLSKNRLGGSLPPELGGMASLTTLNLCSNQLTGTVPTELGFLGALRELKLGGNPLTGRVPDEICNLTKGNDDPSIGVLSFVAVDCALECECCEECCGVGGVGGNDCC